MSVAFARAYRSLHAARRDVVEIPPVDERLSALWHTILDLAEGADDWTLIGGQMVYLHALEHGRTPPRVSEDVDLVVNVRVRPPALPALIRLLENSGFNALGLNSDQIAHRFVLDSVQIDVLAPDGVGSRVDLTTVGNNETVPIPGGSYALATTERVAVKHEGRVGQVPRPSLGGAIHVKARAARADTIRGPERHLHDLAFLCSLVDDPIGLAESLTAAQRQHLDRVQVLLDPEHEAWLRLGAPAGDAHAAFLLLRSDGASRSATDGQS